MRKTVDPENRNPATDEEKRCMRLFGEVAGSDPSSHRDLAKAYLRPVSLLCSKLTEEMPFDDELKLMFYPYVRDTFFAGLVLGYRLGAGDE